ncbi:MAG: DNA-binding response regulator [Segetibacter sp.]|jgi:DNA-binding NarL/FixJ family response regulator|nr:DNA-binding response regulator [Segetibacter sp.]
MIRVAIIEDNVAYRKALEALISKTDDLEIVYTASDCYTVEQAITTIKPDVLIMDIKMPGLSGIEGVKLVKESSPDTNIFMLTVFEDDQNIFESIKAGALGYLLKKDPPEEILGAVRKVHQGEAIMNGKVARKVLEYYSQKPAPKESSEEYNLTTREKEILQHLIKGLSYKEIAAHCFISIDTVFSHIRKIYTKLNVHSRSEISARFR